MSNSKKPKKDIKKKSNLLPFITLAVVIIAVAVVTFYPKGNPKDTAINETNSETNSSSEGSTSSDVVSIAAILNENGDVVINEADITEDVSFIEYKSKEDITVGLVAVRASDGTVRTALDTCQVCNGSPHAYFVQKGDSIQCQNCGNVYSLDMIQQERGGCNPIPIMADEKTITDTEIIIPAVLLEESTEKFENWKKF